MPREIPIRTNMMEMKYKFGWILFSFCIFPIVLLGFITYDIWNDDIYPTVGIAAISFLTDLAMFITPGVLFLSWFPNLIFLLCRWAIHFRIIFDDNGITIGKNVVEIPWSAVRKVDYDFFTGFSFEYTQNEKTFFQCFNYMFANRKRGMEFAFKKIAEHNIPVLVITSDAKEKFENKYGLKIPFLR